MKQTLKKHIPILVYIAILLILISLFWIVDDECGLGFGILSFRIIIPLSTLIISIFYSLKTKSKKKYFLPLFFVISVYIFNFLTYELSNILYNEYFKISYTKNFLYNIKDAILNTLLYGFISVIGIVIGLIINKTKNAIKSK